MNPDDYFKSTRHDFGQSFNYYCFNVLHNKEFWEDYETYFDEKDRAKYIENPVLYLIHLKDKLIESGKMENDRNKRQDFSSFDSARFPDFSDESFCNCHFHQHERTMNDTGMD